MKQLSFGGEMVARAERYYHLTSAVPEADMRAEHLLRDAAMFGDPDAERHVAHERQRAADRSMDQRGFWEFSEGFI